MVWFGPFGLVWLGTTTFALGEPTVRINWTATYGCPLNCSCTKAFDGIMVTVKLARPVGVPAERNRPDVIDRRHQYANWFMAEGVINYCVFIDECGYNIWTARSHGRARVGERAYRQVCGQRGRNVTITMAISPMHGLIYHTAQIGGMNGVRFNDFLVQTKTQMDEEQHVIFIYDGAPAHRSAVQPGPNTELKMLPPYSPFLNIVEQAISALKAAIKADISQLQNVRNGIVSCRYIYIPRCLNREPIEG